jgi:MraZ protein
MGFLGEYESTLDAKGRFLLPTGFRKQLAEGETRFVITRGFEKCLTLYPEKIWKPMFEQICALNDFDKKIRDFRREFLRGATEVELDTAGRLLLPPILKDFAGLQKEIVLTTALNKIEIWDAARYKQLFEFAQEDTFSRNAQEVMANINLNI